MTPRQTHKTKPSPVSSRHSASKHFNNKIIRTIQIIVLRTITTPPYKNYMLVLLPTAKFQQQDELQISFDILLMDEEFSSGFFVSIDDINLATNIHNSAVAGGSADEASTSSSVASCSASSSDQQEHHNERVCSKRFSPVLGSNDVRAIASHSISATKDNIPEKWDVLCGRGRGFFEHPGNRRFLSILEPFKDKYQTASKCDKANIAKRVMTLIMEVQEDETQEDPPITNSTIGGREVTKDQHCVKFWRNDSASGCGIKGKRNRKQRESSTRLESLSWVELDDKEILKKIAHTLREHKSIVRSSVVRSKSPPLPDATSKDESPPRGYSKYQQAKTLTPRIFPEEVNNPGKKTRISNPESNLSNSEWVVSSTDSPACAQQTAHQNAQSMTDLSSFSPSSIRSKLLRRNEVPLLDDSGGHDHSHALFKSPMASSAHKYFQTLSPSTFAGRSSDVARLLNQPLLSFSEDDEFAPEDYVLLDKRYDDSSGAQAR